MYTYPKWVYSEKNLVAQKIVVKYLQNQGGDFASVGFKKRLKQLKKLFKNNSLHPPPLSKIFFIFFIFFSNTL